MTPFQAIHAAVRALTDSGILDPKTDAALLLSSVTGRPPLELRLDRETELSQDEAAAFHTLLSRRLTREPLQYILGSVFFLEHEFRVDPRVLIPRPETELLTERVIQLAQSFPEPRILDLCTGSGCIGISIALALKNAHVVLTDISEDALQLAQQNARTLHAPVELCRGDLFQSVTGCFDVIVSNPPYIPRQDCLTLQPEVLREPMLALDGGEDGLDFYRRIVKASPLYLTPGGWLVMETGDGEADQVLALMQAAGFTETRIAQDYQHLDRMAEGRLPLPD